ncbi:MAG: pyridoxine 5'-phosphate synthase [Burkholderiaceae bacterium]
MNPLITTGFDSHRAHTALSVNLNKVALLRNTRSLGIPSVTRAATMALEAGAQGITVHPRPDERHIRPHDVLELAELMKGWTQAEYNIEGNPFHNLMDVVRELKQKNLPVHQCTFVPDSVSQSTSDHGWNLPTDMDRLRPLVAELRELGVRVSLFMDPEPQAMPFIRDLGAQRVELYTEAYARAHASADQADVLSRYAATAQAALREGLELNAGHDLNQNNLTEFLQAVPGVLEVSIGHALVADALEFGMQETVRSYIRRIHRAYSPEF